MMAIEIMKWHVENEKIMNVKETEQHGAAEEMNLKLISVTEW